jgi:hypothetical protein
MGREMRVGPNGIEHWVVRTRRWLEAWNGCHVRGTRVIMRISSKLVVYDTIWWDHEAWSRSRVMRRCGRCVRVVVVPAQGGRGSPNIGRLPRALRLGPTIDDRVLCHWQILHPRRCDIWDPLPGSPSPPTARLPRRLQVSASGVLFIRCVHFAGRVQAVGLRVAGAYCCVFFFLIVCVDQGRSIGVGVNGAPFLIVGCAPRGCRYRL